MLKIGVRDFGPIIKGEVELKPLTVFIGPNNSGKSYLAILIYALFSGMPRSTAKVEYVTPLNRVLFIDPRDPADSDLVTTVRRFFDEHATHAKRDRKSSPALASLANAPSDLVKKVDRFGQELFGEFIKIASSEIAHAFGGSLSDLARVESRSHKFSISLESRSPNWKLSVRQTKAGLTGRPQFDVYEMFLSENSWTIPGSPKPSELDFSPGLFNQLEQGAYYLPATRFGIFQGYRDLVGDIVRRSAMVNDQVVTTPKFNSKTFKRNLTDAWWRDVGKTDAIWRIQENPVKTSSSWTLTNATLIGRTFLSATTSSFADETDDRLLLRLSSKEAGSTYSMPSTKSKTELR